MPRSSAHYFLAALCEICLSSSKVGRVTSRTKQKKRGTERSARPFEVNPLADEESSSGINWTKNNAVRRWRMETVGAQLMTATLRVLLISFLFSIFCRWSTGSRPKASCTQVVHQSVSHLWTQFSRRDARRLPTAPVTSSPDIWKKKKRKINRLMLYKAPQNCVVY